MAKQSACSRNHKLLLSMVERQVSLQLIADTVGTSRHRVSEYLQRHGVERSHVDQSGDQNPNWHGGRLIDKQGYILIHCPAHPNRDRHGYMREHRLVMEKHLGRYLTRKEVVHHIDDNPQNNVIENLKLYGSNGKHLAETLAGRVPNWTEDGWNRMQEGVARAIENRRRTSRQKSVTDDAS